MTVMTFLLARLLAILFLAASLGASPLPVSQSGDWLFTSDIHLNAADDPALVDRLAAAPVDQWDAIAATSARPSAPYGDDTNFALFRSALGAMKATVPNPQVVIISGDFLAHKYRKKFDAGSSDRSDAAYAAFADKTIAYLAFAFDRAFPHAQFAITLGNNDSGCGDYRIQPHSAFLAHMAQAWEPLVNRGGHAPDFARSFRAYGDYVATLPGGTELVAVNSNAWSSQADDRCDPGDTAKRDVIAWFEGAIHAAPHGARTWVLLHIPPGIDAHTTSQLRLFTISFYDRELLARFRAVRAADGVPPALIVAGHLHNDTYRLVDRTPLLGVPSISPNHGNNPSFFVANVDWLRSTILDYRSYSTDERSGSSTHRFALSYDFDAFFGVHGLTATGIRDVQRAWRDSPGLRAAEASHYVSGSPNLAFRPDDARVWHAYWCAGQAIDVPAFTDCLNTFTSGR
jgi:sphingomyelin phosphodiesterase acid-like 3